MIIECISCDKKFEVNSDLIPNSGRTIQCGSCNHVWFFVPKKVILINKTVYKKSIKKDNISKLKDKKNYEITKYKAKTSFSLSKFLSYILVLIISFIALLIIIDTFRTPLYQFFPNLESIIFSLFETLKDIELFIKDLI